MMMLKFLNFINKSMILDKKSHSFSESLLHNHLQSGKLDKIEITVAKKRSFFDKSFMNFYLGDEQRNLKSILN